MPDDQAQTILAPAQVDNGLKADAWEAFKSSANERELGAKLQGMNLPNKVKADLWEAKRGTAQQQTPNLVTGQGMEAQAQQQSNAVFKKNSQAMMAPAIAHVEEMQKRKNMAMRWQNNNITPVSNASALYAPVTAAKAILGAKVGGSIGSNFGPYGQLAGGLLGGGLAAGIGESPLTPTVNPSTGAAILPEIPSSVMEIPKSIVKKLVANRPIGPSNLSMNEREALELLAQDRMLRGAQQAALDSKAAIAARLAAKNAPQQSPFAGMASTAGGAPPVAAAQTMPQGNATPFVNNFSLPEADAQDLISRMKKLVKPGEEPTAADLKRAGDLTQANSDVLKILAKFGDKLAQNELNRRLKR